MEVALLANIVTAQSDKKTSGKKDCGNCPYFPVCNFDTVRTYGGKEYRGIRNKDESVVWYNCENGIVSKMWDVKEAGVEMDYDGFFYDTYKTKRYEEIILKSNEDKGTSWILNNWESGDGKSTVAKSTIADKLSSIVFDGKTYQDVIKIRRTHCGYGYTEQDVQLFRGSGVKKYQNCLYIDKIVYFGGEDFYYAKNHGLVKRVNIMNDLLQQQNAKEASVPKTTSISDPNHLLYKVITSNCWGASHYFIFDENGTVRQIKRVGNSSPIVWELIPSSQWNGTWELLKNGENYVLTLNQIGSNYRIPDDETYFYIKVDGENYYLQSNYERYYSRRKPNNLKVNK